MQSDADSVAAKLAEIADAQKTEGGVT